MKREIIGYHQDEKQDWVAELDCFHGQHVRHEPPFFNRPWSDSAEGRLSKLGEVLNCLRCDRLEFPENLTAYKKTPEFTENTIPKGLLHQHATKKGTWGKIHVLEGSLIYIPEVEGVSPLEITTGEIAVIPPCVLHSVRSNGEVCFFVEFYSCKLNLLE